MRRFALVLASSVVIPSAVSWSGPAADPSGINKFSPASSEEGCLDIVDTNRPIVRECDDSGPNQQWKLTPIKAGFVQLTTQGMGDKKCLDIINDGKANNRATLAECGNASGQHWKLTPDNGYFTLTTEWRGAKQCLELGQHQVSLSECANKPGQRWKLSKVEARAVMAVDPDSIEIDPRGAFEPQFSLVFEKCPLVLRGHDDSDPAAHYTSEVLSCLRKKASTALCRINPGSVRVASKPSRYVFDVTVTKDTADALVFDAPTTSLGPIEVKSNPKTRDTKMTVHGTEKTITCDGTYGTPREIKDIAKKLAAEDAADREDARNAPPMRSPDSSPSRQPKGNPGKTLGQMCKSNSECQSGKCKSVSRTRSTCN